ncbi:hypothetical protein H2201_002719 [Coniosporium apollinis]|uniref:Transcription initiation factor TFIID subunit 4 n=1 Tax=Coniosporium apollinis TaxID=61459 RepID=A0ABQ9NZ01_9PEZI|nr:hypothetical protein H2201_002719 [Coniosporium apollinis]
MATPTYPPPPPPPQQTFSPYQSTPRVPSPNVHTPGGLALPPNKRPRLDTNPSSPYATSPGSPYLTVPTPGPPTPAYATPQPFNQPQPLNDNMASRAPGSMGPPQRPEKQEKNTDVENLSDAVTASGIDLREEENYLAETYRNTHQNASFNASFNSHSSSTLTPNNSFSGWSPGAYGAHPAFQGTGPLSQPAVAQRTIEEELDAKHRRAARAVAESRQQHLNDPFLHSNTVRYRLNRHAYQNGVTLNIEGLFDKIPERPQNVSTTVLTGADDTGIVSMKSSFLAESASFADILSLISLATNERLRGILEDAQQLARSRQISSNGVVPPDFSSLATANGTVEPTTAVPTSITKTSWDAPDSAVSPMTIPSKRPLSDAQTQHPRLPTLPTPPPEPTIQVKSSLGPALAALSTRARKHEEARLRARAKRLRASSGSADPAADTPPAALIAPEQKLSKKERDRIAKAGQTEDVLHRNANTTASMALGGFGKKYSWMSGGAAGAGAGASRSGTATPARLNTNVGGGAGLGGPVGGAAAAPAAAPVDKDLRARENSMGTWKEDGEAGRGIQWRDVVAALEADGRWKKSMSRVLSLGEEEMKRVVAMARGPGQGPGSGPRY